MKTFCDEFPNWKTGRLKAHQTPQQQLDVILRKWNSGKEMRYEKMMQDLMPSTEEVWELKTPDIRIFGWLYRPRVFVAVLLEYADWYKHPTKRFTYADARARVVSERGKIDLDAPKFATGEFHALV